MRSPARMLCFPKPKPAAIVLVQTRPPSYVVCPNCRADGGCSCSPLGWFQSSTIVLNVKVSMDLVSINTIHLLATTTMY